MSQPPTILNEPQDAITPTLAHAGAVTTAAWITPGGVGHE